MISPACIEIRERTAAMSRWPQVDRPIFNYLAFFQIRAHCHLHTIYLKNYVCNYELNYKKRDGNPSGSIHLWLWLRSHANIIRERTATTAKFIKKANVRRRRLKTLKRRTYGKRRLKWLANTTTRTRDNGKLDNKIATKSLRGKIIRKNSRYEMHTYFSKFVEGPQKSPTEQRFVFPRTRAVDGWIPCENLYLYTLVVNQ